MVQRVLCLGVLMLGLVAANGCGTTGPAHRGGGGGCSQACGCMTYSPGDGPNCACGHPHPAEGAGRR
jgi:hypothetical protein